MLTMLADWPQLPNGWKLSMGTGVAGDSTGGIYIAHRGAHPLIHLDADGHFLASLGESEIQPSIYYKLNATPAVAMGRRFWIHGLSVDHKDNVWVTDVGRHIVMKFDRKGKLLLILGTPDLSGESPTLFNQPTSVLVTPSDDIYVADGYGNSRVVRFSPEGKYVCSWGKRGTGPGEFHIPHSIAMDANERIYIADRGNNRIQVFNRNGELVSVWPDLHSIDAIFISQDGHLYAGAGVDNRILKLDLTGRLRDCWEVMGYPHGLYLDGKENLYVAEIATDRVIRLRIHRE